MNGFLATGCRPSSENVSLRNFSSGIDRLPAHVDVDVDVSSHWVFGSSISLERR